jgi:hypothetical protein
MSVCLFKPTTRSFLLLFPLVSMMGVAPVLLQADDPPNAQSAPLQPDTAPPPVLEGDPSAAAPDMSAAAPALSPQPATPSDALPAPIPTSEAKKDEPEPIPTETTAPPQLTDQTPSEPPVSVASEHHLDRVPPYQLSRPNWGTQITYSAGALGGQDINASQAGNPMRAFAVEFEYQPSFLQNFGVLGIGPSAGLMPIASTGSILANTDIVPSTLSCWSVGGQISYQARYFREQPLVPFVGYNFQDFTYHFAAGPTGSVIASGPSFGLMFLMNILEPTAAAEFYIDHGISRSYLVAEMKSLSGTDANVSFSGQSYFFGLRLEY